MATVSITIPDALVPRLIAAGRGSYPQYDALSDANAFRAITADYWRSILSAWEAQAAVGDVEAQAAVARALAVAKAAADSTGIG